MKLFLDTGAFIARAIMADAHHRSAVERWAELAESGDRLFSSEHVLDETLTLLARRAGYPYSTQWGQRHLMTRRIRWLQTRSEDLHAALRLMQKFGDQSISFTDCVSFVLMRREGIARAFTYDRHFSLAGFRDD